MIHPPARELLSMIESRRKLVKHTRILFVALWLGASASAVSADSKVLPASACQTNSDAFNRLTRNTTTIGVIAGQNNMVCSLVRDNMTNTNGLSALRFRVSKADSTSRTCTAYAVDGYGNVLKSVSRTVSGSGIKNFDFGNTLNVSSSTAVYNVQCGLGLNDIGLNLYYNEPNPGLGADAKAVPGQYCKPAYTIQQVPNYVNRYSTSLGGIFATTLVQCAPLRDRFSNYGSLDSLQVRVQSGSGQLACEAIIADDHENYILNVVREVDGTGNDTLDWGSTMDGRYLVAGHFGLECNLYGTSDYIYSVKWAE